MTKLWVAVPAYTGMITTETAESLQAELYEAFRQKIPMLVQFAQQDPIIHRCRNYLVHNFLASDFTDMVFLDSDVGFPMGTLCKFARSDVDIVGALYPFRHDPIDFPVRWLTEKAELRAENGLLEVEGLPTGCMRIKRRVLEKLISDHPELAYETSDGKTHYALFDFVRRGRTMFGEDYTFCRYAREAGFRIWLDPEIEMTHTGAKVFRGHVGNHLREKMAEETR